MDCDSLIELIRRSVIGRDQMVDGVFGPRPVVYADYTASGRSLSFIEDYIRESVLPLYANTHTESSGTGLQTSRFREDAREIIRSAVGGSNEHAVLFCGSGSTYAIDRMVGVLGLRVPARFSEQHREVSEIPADQRPVVFIGPYEHHSNELPWRESTADVVTIDEDENGHIDMGHLRRQLELHADRPLLIGSFSAASNVTGIVTDTDAIATLLHQHGALSFWDFAAAAPYVEISMGSASADNLAYKDAIFVSPHKFIGGPGTPGVLVARKELFSNSVPDVPGGGTVKFVNADDHAYLDEIEHREEGGTPAIVESIRAGLVFQLKEAVGPAEIRRREESFVSRAVSAWDRNEAIWILGNHDAERLSIVSFVVKHGDRHLHHNYVVALLNDLFGIQSRGGCSCAGPYGHRLLHIDIVQSHEFEREISRGCEGIKPGWVRVNFNYFIDESVFDYVVAAVDLVATHGAKLLPFYRLDPDTGIWRHRSGASPAPMSLHDIDYSSGCMEFPPRTVHPAAGSLNHYLDEARRIFAEAETHRPAPIGRPEVSSDFESLRWFPLPDDISS